MDTTESLGFWGSKSEEVIGRQYPLHKACRDGDVLGLSRLVAQATPHQLVEEDRFYGWTPLHWAAYFGKNQCLMGLLQTGVNVNIHTSRLHQTPSHISAFGGHPSCLLGLLNAGADFHAKDYLGELPLHKAARVGNTQCVITLIENGANPSVHNANGHTAADLSRMQNFKECTNLLETALVLTKTEKCDTDGHHEVINGSSGSQLNFHNENGFTNGNGYGSKKRGSEHESISTIKRPRTEDVSSIKQITSIKLDCHKLYENNNITSHHEAGDMKDTNSNSNMYNREPSPGIDFNQNKDEYDLQLWGYMQGYGDTAECIPDDSSINNNCKEYCISLQGVKSKGWS